MLAEGLVLDLYPSLGPRADARSPWAGVGVRSTVFERPLSQPALTFRFGGGCCARAWTRPNSPRTSPGMGLTRAFPRPLWHGSRCWDALRRGHVPRLTATSSPSAPTRHRSDKAFRDGWPRAARNSGPSGAQAPQELVARSAVGPSGIVRNDESGRNPSDFSAGIVPSDHSVRPKARASGPGAEFARRP